MLAKHKVALIASVPDVFEDGVELQRGENVFKRVLSVIKKLNNLGYGVDPELKLSLVHNPQDGKLPLSQDHLDRKYREVLNKEYDLTFSNLITITNVPINRYKESLEENNMLECYQKTLVEAYNATTISGLMCRYLISVDYKGYIYDCDFNQAIDIKTKKFEEKLFWDLDLDKIDSEITFSDHCYACTASYGSSCSGAIVTEIEEEIDQVIKDETIIDNVKDYYGKELSDSTDLKTSACCTTETIPSHVKKALSYVADEVVIKYYGCGSPIPVALENCSILDLGCGTGRDSFVLSYLGGESCLIYGIDMTKEQIEIAEKYRDTHAKRFSYNEPNTTFIHDYIENVDNHFKHGSLDIITSNCVMNLVNDKEAVFKKTFKLLKNGGEFYFSDVYSDRRVPEEVRNNPIIYGECLGGALYINDFFRLAKKSGFVEPREIKRTPIELDDEIKDITGNIKFYSITFRLWKIEGLENKCEDYGQIAIYKGGVKESPSRFDLDNEHFFEKGRAERLCGNTALMLSASRFGKYFDIIGNTDTHYGEYTVCGTMVQDDQLNIEKGSCC
jgi:SAM-dependent methyltransferase